MKAENDKTKAAVDAWLAFVDEKVEALVAVTHGRNLGLSLMGDNEVEAASADLFKVAREFGSYLERTMSRPAVEAGFSGLANVFMRHGFKNTNPELLFDELMDYADARITWLPKGSAAS